MAVKKSLHEQMLIEEEKCRKIVIDQIHTTEDITGRSMHHIIEWLEGRIVKEEL